MATDQLIEKSLPHNVEAERSVLGVILLDNASCNLAVPILKREDFYLDSHRRIYDRVVQLSEANKAIDLVTLAEELGRAGELESVGGAAYLSSLIDGMPRATNVEHYARIVKEKSLLRKMIHVSNQIVQQCLEGSEDPETLLDSAENNIFQLAEDRVRAGFHGVMDIVHESFGSIDALIDRQGRITGVSTGYPELDTLTSGLQPSELIILAARPSVGKTALALNIAEHVAIHEKKTVGIFSMEMSKEALLMRLLSSQARVNMREMLFSPSSQKANYAKLTLALSELATAPIFMDDTPALTVMEMRAKCRRLKKEHDLSLVIVDYLQLMSGKGRFENRVQEVSSLSRGLKALAKELHVPVMALSQLSRAPEQGSDHRPQLSHLRESGTIEQDADLVMFIFREEIYKPTEENAGLAEIIVGKQRNGPTGKVELVFLKPFTRFERREKEQY